MESYVYLSENMIFENQASPGTSKNGTDKTEKQTKNWVANKYPKKADFGTRNSYVLRRARIPGGRWGREIKKSLKTPCIGTMRRIHFLRRFAHAAAPVINLAGIG